jgi:hypothetical protein
VIYFAQPVDGGPVKIGTTGDLDSRLRTLESHYRRRFAVLATMEGGLQGGSGDSRPLRSSPAQ